MKRRDTLATTAVTLLALAGVVLPAGTAAAQTARDLVGTWMSRTSTSEPMAAGSTPSVQTRKE